MKKTELIVISYRLKSLFRKNMRKGWEKYNRNYQNKDRDNKYNGSNKEEGNKIKVEG